MEKPTPKQIAKAIETLERADIRTPTFMLLKRIYRATVGGEDTEKWIKPIPEAVRKRALAFLKREANTN